MKSALSDFIFGKNGDLWYSSHYYINNVSFFWLSVSRWILLRNSVLYTVFLHEGTAMYLPLVSFDFVLEFFLAKA